MTTTSSKNNLVIFLLLLAALAAILPLVANAVFAPCAHAIERHGFFQASVANECRDDPSAKLFINKETGRTAYVCMTSVDKWGVSIIDRIGNNITSFLKNKMTSYDQVAQYLINRGYTPLH